MVYTFLHIYLNDAVNIQTGDSATRTVDSGTERRRWAVVRVEFGGVLIVLLTEVHDKSLRPAVHDG